MPRKRVLPTASAENARKYLVALRGVKLGLEAINRPEPGEAQTLKLHTSARAPNPRRVDMFIAEKGIDGIPRQLVDLNAGEHRSAAFTARNPMARVPVLELDDGRFLSESRAICTYLEGLYPEPNLMGETAEERAFIEMADRQAEFHLLATIANFVRHTHPGLLVLENPQFPDFGTAQGERMLESCPVRRQAGIAPLDGGRPIHDRGHHGVLRHRVRPTGQVQAG